MGPHRSHPLQRPFGGQQGGHAGGLARLNAYPGVFKHQAVGRVGAELFGHFQEGVRVEPVPMPMGTLPWYCLTSSHMAGNTRTSSIRAR